MKLGTKNLFVVNVPTPDTGRTYPQMVVEEAILRYGDRPLFNINPVDQSLDLTQVGLQVSNLRIEGGWLVGDAEILNTPTGQTLIPLAEKIHLVMSSIGIVSDDKVVSDLTFRGVLVQVDL